MDTTGTGRLVAAALDSVLVPAGFQQGQYGDDRASGTQVIFCAGHDELSQRHPDLPQAGQQGYAGRCVDLVVNIGADGALGRLDMEGFTLEETLRHVGLIAQGDAVAQLSGRPVSEGLPSITAALRQLFDEVR